MNLKFNEKIEQMLNEMKSRNVDVGLPIKDKGAIADVEKWLDDNNIIYNNEGSDHQTYNINVGFDDLKLSEKFMDYLDKNNYHYENETF